MILVTFLRIYCYFEDLLKKLSDILKRLDEERINSTFETPLNDFKFDVK